MGYKNIESQGKRQTARGLDTSVKRARKESVMKLHRKYDQCSDRLNTKEISTIKQFSDIKGGVLKK